jgi:uncharacterized membrane protein (UPF0127 family)
MRRWFIVVAAAMFAILLISPLAGCGEKASTLEDMNSTDVTLRNGTKVICETMRQDIDLTRGLMFRDSLPSGHGMLFVYPANAKHQHWTYQVKFPIDTIWMDGDHNVVEIVADMQPCTAKAAHECELYGGKQLSHYSLEVPAGFAAKNGVKVGDRIDF